MLQRMKDNYHAYLFFLHDWRPICRVRSHLCHHLRPESRVPHDTIQLRFKGFGQATDMIKFAPTTQLSAAIDVWGPYYIKRIGAVLDGSWKSQDIWGGFDSGLLEMAPFTNMPAEIANIAAATVAAIKSGKNKVFTGPILDQAGTTKLAAGATMDDGALNAMQWLAQGVEGKLT